MTSHVVNSFRIASSLRLRRVAAQTFTLCLLMTSALFAAEFELRFDELEKTSYLDRWMYPFNITPGTRIQASTFGAIGTPEFDDRDGQFILAIDTASVGIESGMPASTYRINSATLTLTETFGGYQYDPTYDAFATYLDPTTSTLAVEDVDEGRPLELYGVGLRNGFTEFAFPDGSNADVPTFGSGVPFGGEGKRVRSAFAADVMGNDISNNVDSAGNGADGFETTPFAVARIFRDAEEIEPGEYTISRDTWLFEIDVENVDVQTYFANALANGQLGLAVTSMHTTGVQGVGDPFPNPATANHFAFDGPVLTLDVEIVEDVDGTLGDFDGDDLLSNVDIDLISAAVRENSLDAQFDLNGDGNVSDLDRERWLQIANVIAGDANLDGEVAFPDFLSLSAGFGDVGGWASGDFDGNGNVAFPDFLTLSANFGKSRVSVANVPEPASPNLFWTALATFTLLRKRKNTK